MTTPLEIMVVSHMKGYLWQMPQDESDVAQIAVEMLREVEGKWCMETMRPEFVEFIQDAYRSLKNSR